MVIVHIKGCLSLKFTFPYTAISVVSLIKHWMHLQSQGLWVWGKRIAKGWANLCYSGSPCFKILRQTYVTTKKIKHWFFFFLQGYLGISFINTVLGASEMAQHKNTCSQAWWPKSISRTYMVEGENWFT